jgi:RNA polymerase sigma factor FliA
MIPRIAISRAGLDRLQEKQNRINLCATSSWRIILHLVRYNAERIHVKLPDEVELDDEVELMSAGIFGLMDAISAFDLERGVKFETYCAPRIRGAILDELRSMDWVPSPGPLARPQARQRHQEPGNRTRPLARPTKKWPSASRCRWANSKKWPRTPAPSAWSPSLRKWFETDSNKDVREIDVLEDKRGADPVREIQRKDLKELMTKGLSRAERLIIMLYYFEEMTMKEIGATLDLEREPRQPDAQLHSREIARPNGRPPQRIQPGRRDLIDCSVHNGLHEEAE